MISIGDSAFSGKKKIYKLDNMDEVEKAIINAIMIEKDIEANYERYEQFAEMQQNMM